MPETRILEDAVHILGNLISFPVLGGQSNLNIAQYIEEKFALHGLPYTRVPNETNDKRSIHCRVGPEVDGGIILSGHMDVVPTKGQNWTKPDFSLTRDNERLYGRGTTDMKGFLACCLAMLPEIIDAKLKIPIYLAFSYDEEVGCLAGPDLVTSILASYVEKPSYAIIGEPTGMQVVTAEKGMAAFQTIIKSTPAHSSQIMASTSAIEESANMINWLTLQRQEFANSKFQDHRFDPSHTTIHVGTIHGGSAFNIVAEHCSFEWDVRNVPGDAVADILNKFQAYCSDRKVKNQSVNADFSINTIAQFTPVPGLNTDEDSKFIQMLYQWNHQVNPASVAYASEAGQFSNGGFQSVLCGPGYIDQAHKADEYIDVNQLQECLDFLHKLIQWSQNPSF